MITDPDLCRSGTAQAGWPVAMQNPVRDYDWGSRTVLAELQGREPSGTPEAELWVGAHPSAPSWLVEGRRRERLDEAIAARPAELLGVDCLSRFGPRLPFLTKLLAIERALSVQVHPSREQAEQGYAAQRYGDPFPKPEMIHALAPLTVLAGCRPRAEALDLLDRLILAGEQAGDRDRAGLHQVRRSLGSADLRAVITLLEGWSPDRRTELFDQVRRAAAAVTGARGVTRATAVTGATEPDPFHWIGVLSTQHPADPLILAPALLTLLVLEPGQTMFVPAGVPHAYLHGFGLEVMAPSDNVVRAGLTSKPVDVPTLVELLDPLAQPLVGDPGERVDARARRWRPPTEYFSLTRVDPDPEPGEGTPYPLPTPTGPAVALCTRDWVVLTGERQVTLTAGRSAFLGPAAGTVTVTGPGELFLTGVGADPGTIAGGAFTSGRGTTSPAGS